MSGWLLLALLGGAWGVGYWMAWVKTQTAKQQLTKREATLKEAGTQQRTTFAAEAQNIHNLRRRMEAEIDNKRKTMVEETERQARTSRAALDYERRIALEEIEKKRSIAALDLKQEKEQAEKFIEQVKEGFQNDFCEGRKWLAEFIAEAEQSRDSEIEYWFRHKTRPAVTTADLFGKIKAEKRELLSGLKFA